jgi:hypothetical protein
LGYIITGGSDYDLSDSDISGSVLTYRIDYDDGRDEIKILDVRTGYVLRTVEVTDGNIGRVNVQGSRVAWKDVANGEYRCRDFERSIVSTIFSTVGSMYYPRIWGDRVIYRDNRFDSGDIFMVELDYDHDGVLDSKDMFPDNPDEAYDLDGDRMGDNADPDADGDGIPDLNDDFYLDPKEWSDYDRDGIGDNTDPDDDNDGLKDSIDDQPKNSVNSLEKNILLILKMISTLESDIEIKMDDMRDDILRTYSGLNFSLRKYMEIKFSGIIGEIASIIENIANIDFTQELITENMTLILNNLTSFGGSIYEDFDEIQVATDTAIQLLDSVLEKIPLNDTSHFEEVISYLEQMTALLVVIDDIEDLNSEMKSQKNTIESTEDTSKNLSIIIIILLVILALLSIISIFRGSERYSSKSDHVE